MTTIAAFDFDGTLTERDSVVPFLLRFTTVPRLAASLLRHIHRLVPMVARRDRDRLRALATELVFRGRAISAVQAEAAGFGAQLATTGLRPDTAARLAWHLGEAHRVVIVSASYEHYVAVVAAALGDVDVLATRLEVVDGACTGDLDGPNCRGPEKVRRLEGWLCERGLQRADVTVFAYGDSSGDREMLAWADHPHRVNEPVATVAPTD
jgi:phosphatidylglycerophosphatase C